MFQNVSNRIIKIIERNNLLIMKFSNFSMLKAGIDEAGSQ